MSASVLLTSISVLAALLPGSTTSTPATPSCQGHPATIVGHPDPNGSLSGTDGDDVIITNGIGAVSSGPGDDRICMTRTNNGRFQYVDAGAGDDRVTVSTSDDIHATLGEGDDVFRGGAGNDFVQADAPGPSGDADAPEGHDRIRSGGGADEVTVGLPGAATTDDVDLGPGDDQLHVSGLLAPEVRPRGGAGSDLLRIEPELPGHAWAIDNASETATVDGAVQGRWESFQRFDLTWLNPSTLTFSGGVAAEEVYAGRALLAADLHAGDDLLALTGLPDDHVAEISGGSGRDVFAAETASVLTIDLALRGAWSGTDTSVGPSARLDGVEGATGVSDRVRLIGDSADNLLDAFGCRATADGGAGHDRIVSTPVPDTLPCPARETRMHFSGGPGADVLHGGSGPDRLSGGRGDDIADGDRGTDRCRAEVRRSCERR